MDYFSIMDISATGMDVQKARLDVVALNLANVSTTRGVDGGPYRPLEVIVGQKTESGFDNIFGSFHAQYSGATVVDVVPQNIVPRLVHNPDHPDANEAGMVAFPDINPVSEMVNLMESTQAYEANVRAVNAAKTMALRALEIGKG